jgi:DNA/RNA endonuclease G (NUC1)
VSVILQAQIVELQKDCFKIYFDTVKEIPVSGHYTLYGKNMDKPPLKRVGFRGDKQLPKEYRIYSSQLTYSGFQRGHIIGNNAFNDNKICQKETFLMSNVVPQYRKSNVGSWYDLEKKEIEYATKEGSVQVISGTCGCSGYVYKKKRSRIVKMCIPGFLFKGYKHLNGNLEYYKVTNNKDNNTFKLIEKNKLIKECGIKPFNFDF